MRFALTSLLSLLLAPLAGDEPVALVRNADLAQFDLVGLEPESIAIADGEVRLAGRPLGYFATKQDYGNFVLFFEWKYDRPEGLTSDAEFRGNSGVLIRIARPHKVWPSCVEVQLAQADPGALFAVGTSRFQGVVDPERQKKAVRAVGEWNRSEVTCRGGMITSVLNGDEVARGEGADSAPGPIGWQSEGKPIRFRNLRIKALP